MMRKTTILLLLLALCLCLVLPAAAAEDRYLLVDWGDLLTDEEEQTLNAQLNELSAKHEMDIVAVTEASLGGMTAQNYADDFYDYNGYGYGENYDGLVLLLCPNEDVRYISTCGAAIEIFQGDSYDEMTGQIRSYANSGEFYKALQAYAEGCDELITEANAFPVGMLIIALLIGAVLSFLIPMSVLKGQLKTVYSKAAASDYMRPGSLKLTEKRDIFLYRNVTRTARPKENASSSSSGTHTSSSGRSHGGGSF